MPTNNGSAVAHEIRVMCKYLVAYKVTGNTFNCKRRSIYTDHSAIRLSIYGIGFNSSKENIGLN